ncbi:hypothetical protein ACFQ7N_40625 [Streptomyces niveus]|uniref:hypothetical protein n=1 Tax=Streptomyces niveus TaxID=193462 RepID=UPI0036B5E202
MTESVPYRYDPSELTAANDEALARLLRAEQRQARVACALIAATVRGILTEDDPNPDAPFDAATFRLTVNEFKRVTADGTYWTTAGEERRITDPFQLYGLDEWVHQLDHYNRAVWEPLCQYDGTAGRQERHRLHLAQAVELPAEVKNTARAAEIRARLAAATSRPWGVEEIVTTRHGGLAASGDPDAVHTDFLVTDADGIQVAEVSVNHDGPGDTETPDKDINDSRANAVLIANAPQDLQFLLAHLDEISGGDDAETAHLRGSCGLCGTALYTSAVSETPAALDGGTQCKDRRTFLGFPIQHVLRH